VGFEDPRKGRDLPPCSGLEDHKLVMEEAFKRAAVVNVITNPGFATPVEHNIRTCARRIGAVAVAKLVTRWTNFLRKEPLDLYIIHIALVLVLPVQPICKHSDPVQELCNLFRVAL
jgi:hypothetical protein